MSAPLHPRRSRPAPRSPPPFVPKTGAPPPRRNTLALELFGVAFMWSGPDEGPIQIVTVIITGSIAAALCFTGIFVARRVFR